MMLDHHQPSPGPSSSSSAAPVFERIMNGKNGHRMQTAPEVYSGKTGLDLPNIHVGPLLPSVRACHTGPDGGLTKVQPMRQRTIAKMAKLDDEEFSLSSMDEDEEETEECGQARACQLSGMDQTNVGEKMARHSGRPRKGDSTTAHRLQQASSMEALGFGPDDQGPRRSQLERRDWAAGWDEQRAIGVSTSLYEKHPVTGMSAGSPIADVFAIIARQNNAVLALADGVNWGDGARLAARCAIRGAMEHVDAAIERQQFRNTNDIFHSMLGAFHAAHALILQEGGALTTLCVALVAPVRDSNSSVLCVCNVGDSLCFVYNSAHGVREVTQASHDIGQMRDMRDAGGALGPVDGRNPQLHNLTCSMTFVEDGDLVFITSDGISDNFDPVVGKFCVIRRPREDSSEKENDLILMGSSLDNGHSASSPAASASVPPPLAFHKTKSAPATAASLTSDHFKFPPAPANSTSVPPIRPLKRPPAATLPCVDALQRHELMLLRMGDVIPNGLCPASDSCIISTASLSANSASPSPCAQQKMISAGNLCRNLVQFAHQLSSAKRRTLEDPELYRTRTHSKTEERLRRKMIRNMIMEMPGKLDHASVVAYRVGSQWPSREEECRMKNGGDGAGAAEEENDGSDGEEEGLTMSKSAREKFFIGENAEADERKDAECQAGVAAVRIPQNNSIDGTTNTGEAQGRQSVAIQCSWRPPTTTAPHRSNGRVPTATERKNQMSLAEIPRSADGQKSNRAGDQAPVEEEKSLLRSPYEDLPVDIGSVAVELEAKEGLVNGGRRTETAADGIGGTKKKKQHSRGSLARHTLGVDVSWLKRLVTSKHGGGEPGIADEAMQNSGAGNASPSPHLSKRQSAAVGEQLNGGNNQPQPLGKLRRAFKRQQTPTSRAPPDSLKEELPRSAINSRLEENGREKPPVGLQQPMVPRMGIGQMNGGSGGGAQPTK